MADIFIPNPVAALPPARAMFRPPPPAQTAGIFAQALPQIGQQIAGGIEGLAAAKQQKADLEATAAFLDDRGNPAAAALLRTQAANINPLFSSGALGGSGRGGGGGVGGGLGGSLVRDILRNDMEKELIQARGQQAIAEREAAFQNSLSLENVRAGNRAALEASTQSAYDNRLTQSFMQKLATEGHAPPEAIVQARKMAASGNYAGAMEHALSNVYDPAVKQQMRMDFERQSQLQKNKLAAQQSIANHLTNMQLAAGTGMLPSRIGAGGSMEFAAPSIKDDDVTVTVTESPSELNPGTTETTRRVSGSPEAVAEWEKKRAYEAGKTTPNPAAGVPAPNTGIDLSRYTDMID